MRFLIDENVRLEIAEFLRNEGHDIKTIPSGIENSEVIRLAQKEQRILLTHDIHFSNILLYPPKQYSGIIRIKIHPPLVDKIVSALKYLLSKTSPEEFDKKLFVLEKDNFRIRK